MFKSILDILDRACLSPEREGQEMLPDGSIVYNDNSSIVWNYDSDFWKCQPVANEVHIFVLINCCWKLNSKIKDMEDAVEFGHDLVNTLLENLEEFEDAS